MNGAKLTMKKVRRSELNYPDVEQMVSDEVMRLKEHIQVYNEQWVSNSKQTVVTMTIFGLNTVREMTTLASKVFIVTMNQVSPLPHDKKLKSEVQIELFW